MPWAPRAHHPRLATGPIITITITITTITWALLSTSAWAAGLLLPGRGSSGDRPYSQGRTALERSLQGAAVVPCAIRYIPVYT